MSDGHARYLELEVSRGDNVSRIRNPNGFEQAWDAPSAKRQKIVRRRISSSSDNSADELLDQQNPEAISFSPSQRSSQAFSIHGVNSQGSAFPGKKYGFLPDLTEHRNVEKMMHSGGPSKNPKPKRHQYDQSPQRNRGQTLSPELPSIKSTDTRNFEELDMKPRTSHEPLCPGRAKSPFSAGNVSKANISKPLQSLGSGRISPYFSQSRLPMGQQYDTEGRLANKFVSVNGMRRCSDLNLSSDADELQMGTTVGNNPDTNALSSLNRSYSKSPSKGLQSMHKAMSTTEENLDLDPSTIEHSKFVDRKPKTHYDIDPIKIQPHEEKASWSFNIISVATREKMLCQEGMALVHSEKDSSYVVMNDGKYTSLQFQPQKLDRIRWGSPGRKARFMFSQTGRDDNTMDFEFCNEKDLCEVVKRLQTEGLCKVENKPWYA